MIRRTERRRCSSTSNSTERDFVVLARCVGPDGHARDILFNNLSMPSSDLAAVRAIIQQWFSEMPSQPGVVRRQLGRVESHFRACAMPPLTIAQIKAIFFKRKKTVFTRCFLQTDIKETRQDEGRREEGSVQALIP